MFFRRISEKFKVLFDFRCFFIIWSSLVLLSFSFGDGVRDENREERLSFGEEFLEEYREGIVRWFLWIVCIWESVSGVIIFESKFTIEFSFFFVVSGFFFIMFCVVIFGKRILLFIDVGIYFGFLFFCIGFRSMCIRIFGLFSIWIFFWGVFKLGLFKFI